MKTVHPSPLLRSALLLDAMVSGATGLLQLAAADSLATMLDLPRAGLAATGEFFVVYALALLAMGMRRSLWSGLVTAVVLGNSLWALGCVALLLMGVLTPGALGIAFVLVQAVAVAAFAALQWRGLRGSLPAAAPARVRMS